MTIDRYPFGRFPFSRLHEFAFVVCNMNVYLALAVWVSIIVTLFLTLRSFFLRY